MADSWIVAVTKSQREPWAAANVARQGYDSYFPQFQEEYINRKRRMGVRVRSLFPRYLFVRTDGPWMFLLSTFGVIGVVRNGDVPITVSDAVVKELRQRERELDVVKLFKPPQPFKHGQRVRVSYGSMCGLTGTCEKDYGSERIRVQLQFLGGQRFVSLPRDYLAAA